jgi:hypothetical protein
MDFILFRTGDPLDVLGTFTIDPALAEGTVGEFTVPLTDLEFTATVPVFGEFTVTFADITTPTYRAYFLDGQLASVGGLGGGMLSSGYGFFLDFAEFIPADPSLIDLNAVGTFTFDVGLDTGMGLEVHSAHDSMGIRPVPEPGTLALLVAAGVVSACRRRRQQAAVRL